VNCTLFKPLDYLYTLGNTIALFVFNLDYQNYGILKMGLPKPIYWHNFFILYDGHDIILHIIWEKKWK
jgi:hypothetical protein